MLPYLPTMAQTLVSVRPIWPNELHPVAFISTLHRDCQKYTLATNWFAVATSFEQTFFWSLAEVERGGGQLHSRSPTRHWTKGASADTRRLGIHNDQGRPKDARASRSPQDQQEKSRTSERTNGRAIYHTHTLVHLIQLSGCPSLFVSVRLSVSITSRLSTVVYFLHLYCLITNGAFSRL